MAIVVKKSNQLANNANKDLVQDSTYLLGNEKVVTYMRSQPANGNGVPLTGEKAIAENLVKTLAQFLFKRTLPENAEYETFKKLRAAPYSLTDFRKTMTLIETLSFIIKVPDAFNRNPQSRRVIVARTVVIGAKVDQNVLEMSARKLKLLQSSAKAEVEVIAVAQLAFDALDMHITSLEKQAELDNQPKLYKPLTQKEQRKVFNIENQTIIDKRKNINNHNCCVIV